MSKELRFCAEDNFLPKLDVQSWWALTVIFAQIPCMRDRRHEVSRRQLCDNGFCAWFSCSGHCSCLFETLLEYRRMIDFRFELEADFWKAIQSCGNKTCIKTSCCHLLRKSLVSQLLSPTSQLQEVGCIVVPRQLPEWVGRKKTPSGMLTQARRRGRLVWNSREKRSPRMQWKAQCKNPHWMNELSLNRRSHDLLLWPAFVHNKLFFFACRQLQCDRVTLHKNLFISYILNGSVWIFYYTLAALNGDVLMSNPVSTKNSSRPFRVARLVPSDVKS